VIPAFQYRHGYVAEVQGARVTSPPGAGVLTVAQSTQSNSAVGIVTIEIRPVANGRTTTPEEASISACT
jgi:hypothetical protein